MDLPPANLLHKLTITELKVLLVDHGIEIPPTKQKKQFYFDLALETLYNVTETPKATPRVTPRATSAAASFGSHRSFGDTPSNTPRGEVSEDYGFGRSPTTGYPLLAPQTGVAPRSEDASSFSSPAPLHLSPVPSTAPHRASRTSVAETKSEEEVEEAENLDKFFAKPEWSLRKKFLVSVIICSILFVGGYFLAGNYFPDQTQIYSAKFRNFCSKFLILISSKLSILFTKISPAINPFFSKISVFLSKYLNFVGQFLGKIFALLSIYFKNVLTEADKLVSKAFWTESLTLIYRQYKLIAGFVLVSIILSYLIYLIFTTRRDQSNLIEQFSNEITDNLKSGVGAVLSERYKVTLIAQHPKHKRFITKKWSRIMSTVESNPLIVQSDQMVRGVMRGFWEYRDKPTTPSSARSSIQKVSVSARVASEYPVLD
ncbi:hypothetical protein RCL1_006942 [Eukaryota sp. TZLM3-RCL]